MDLLIKAKTELSDIEQRIGDLLKRKSDLQSFIAAGERLYGASAAAFSVEQVQQEPHHLTPSVRRRLNDVLNRETGERTKKAKISAIIQSALFPDKHLPARELAALVQQQGIDLGGDPISTISVVLSRDPQFKSERAKGGWTLVSGPNKEETPQGVAAPAGLDLLDFQPATPNEGSIGR